MDKLVTIRKTDFGIRPGVYRETEIFQHLAHQQYLYMNGRDSTWGVPEPLRGIPAVRAEEVKTWQVRSGTGQPNGAS